MQEHKTAPSQARQKPLARRELNKQATRAGILRAARKLFAKHGYAKTSLEAVVRSARVTTGAVYDHFGDKRSLFCAVAEAAEMEILQRLAKTTAGIADPWSKLVTATMSMLEICSEPSIRQIVFVDAPNVIGASEWHAIELRYSYGAMREVLAQLLAAGEIRALPVDLLAPMLLGALIAAANNVALAGDGKAALRNAREAASIFLQALRVG
jgi:AcrR family transcriptional regulator